jgi:hypothetical protein
MIEIGVFLSSGFESTMLLRKPGSIMKAMFLVRNISRGGVPPSFVFGFTGNLTCFSWLCSFRLVVSLMFWCSWFLFGPKMITFQVGVQTFEGLGDHFMEKWCCQKIFCYLDDCGPKNSSPNLARNPKNQLT